MQNSLQLAHNRRHIIAIACFLTVSFNCVGQVYFNSNDGLIKINEESSNTFYNVIKERYDTVIVVYEENGELKDSILKIRVSFDRIDNNTINVTWDLIKNKYERTIQKGMFINNIAEGKFFCYFPYDSAYCFYLKGMKEGCQIETEAGEVKTSNFRNNIKEGIEYTLEKGLIKNLNFYSNGKLSGISQQYYLSDSTITLKYSHNYNDGKIRNGLFVNYHPNGKVFIEGIYINGLEEGWFNVYNTNGEISKRIKYKNGEIVKFKD